MRLLRVKKNLDILGVPSILILLGCLAAGTSAEDMEVGVDCKSIITNLVKAQLVKIKECLSEMEFSNGKEKSEKMLCVMVCSMKKARFIDAEGKTDAIASMSYIENEVPAELRDRVTEGFLSCHQHLGKIQPTDDPFCKSYEPLMKCAQSALNNVCL